MLMEFSVMPVCSKRSIADQIAKLSPLLEASGLDYRMNAMSTVVEGDWDSLCALARKCHMRLREENDRVLTTLRFDDEAGREGEILGNLQAVERELGTPVRT